MSTDQNIICLLLGDGALVQKKAEEVIQKVLPQGKNATNYFRHDADEAVDQPFIDAQTLSMFAPRKVVLISGMERANIQMLDNLLHYVMSPNPMTTLVLCGENLPKKGPVQRLRKQIKEIGRIEKFDRKNIVPRNQLRHLLQSENMQFSTSAAQLLIKMVGKDLFGMENEVRKIRCFMGDDPRMVIESDVEQVCSTIAETNIWSLSDAIVRRNADAALTELYRMLEERKAPHHLFGIICWQMRQLLELQEWMDSGERRLPKSWARTPNQKRESAIRTLKKYPLQPEKIFRQLVGANRRFNSSHAGDRRNIEALVIALCTQ